MSNNQQKQIISEIVEISRNTLDKSKVLDLFVQFGKLLEIKGAENYELVEFYRDWMVHTEIDRNKTRLKVLEDIEKAINENFETSNENFRDKLTASFYLEELRIQVNDLMSKYQEDGEFFCKDKWRRILTSLLSKILNTRLTIKNCIEGRKKVTVEYLLIILDQSKKMGVEGATESDQCYVMSVGIKVENEKTNEYISSNLHVAVKDPDYLNVN